MVYIHNNTRFEWDDDKNAANINRHGIQFFTATLVFDDLNRVDLYDDNHSESEDRYKTIGMINGETIVLSVIYTPRGESIRIISARKATKTERSLYNDYINNL